MRVSYELELFEGVYGWEFCEEFDHKRDALKCKVRSERDAAAHAIGYKPRYRISKVMRKVVR